MVKFTKTGFKKMLAEIQKTVLEAPTVQQECRITQEMERLHADFLSKSNRNHPDIIREMVGTPQFPPTRMLPNLEQVKSRRLENDIVEPLSLKNFLVNGENTYLSIPQDFSAYVRGSTSFQEYRKKLETLSAVFSKANMAETAKSVSAKIGFFDFEKDEYHGFRRMSPSLAAATSALTYNFKLSNNRIVIPRKFFKNEYWVNNGTKSIRRGDDEINGLIYEPYVFPLHLSSPSKICQEIADKYDRFINDCPAFDSYWVVQPCVSTSSWSFMSGGNFIVKDPNSGDISTFKDYRSAAMKLIELLRNDNVFHSVLLGERDSKCYFVSLV